MTIAVGWTLVVAVLVFVVWLLLFDYINNYDDINFGT